MNNDDLKGQAYGRSLGLPGCQVYSQDELEAAVKAAVDAERERCAKLCDLHSRLTWNDDRKEQSRVLAAEIRRGV